MNDLRIATVALANLTSRATTNRMVDALVVAVNGADKVGGQGADANNLDVDVVNAVAGRDFRTFSNSPVAGAQGASVLPAAGTPWNNIGSATLPTVTAIGAQGYVAARLNAVTTLAATLAGDTAATSRTQFVNNSAITGTNDVNIPESARRAAQVRSMITQLTTAFNTTPGGGNQGTPSGAFNINTTPGGGITSIGSTFTQGTTMVGDTITVTVILGAALTPAVTNCTNTQQSDGVCTNRTAQTINWGATAWAAAATEVSPTEFTRTFTAVPGTTDATDISLVAPVWEAGSCGCDTAAGHN
jgi:hypothetical protein